MLCPGCSHDNSSTAKFCEECGARLDAPADEALGYNHLTHSDFVGRQREMGELVAALDDAIAGRGRLVMLVGEPGIGKTRLAQELAAISEGRGAQVMWGRCYEGEGAPPYWPWVQSIRAYIQDREPEHIASLMDAGATDIAEIVPQLRQKLPDLAPPPALEPEAARFRLFDSITTFLKRASETKPLVLILDNLHWADRTSLLLLEFLASELERSHILVLGTYRDVDVSRRHPLSQTLGVLIREHLFQRVQLRGMTLEEVDRFIEITAETSVPPRCSPCGALSHRGQPPVRHRGGAAAEARRIRGRTEPGCPYPRGHKGRHRQESEQAVRGVQPGIDHRFSHRQGV